MARTNRMQTETQNPANKFIKWSSKHEQWLYYDKQEQENILLGLELQFLALVRYKTIKGWNQKKEFSLISNEVKSLNDIITVTAYPKNGEKYQLCSGDWKSIKDEVENNKGKYTESVYAMLPDGEVVNLQLNGSSLSTWFEFQKNQTDRFFDNWVVVKGFKKGTQGAVEYTYPVFEWGTTLSTEEQVFAESADHKIGQYEESYFGNSNDTKENFRERSEVDKYEMENSKPPIPPTAVDAELAMHDSLPQEYDDLPF
ncbi:MAG: hypothetical protein AAF901_12775 [Bacteroidota bacterium]